MLAQKGAAADGKFQDAARMRAEAEDATRVVQGLQLLNQKWDDDVFRQVAKGLHMSEDEIEATLESVRTPANPSPNGNPGNIGRGQAPAPANSPVGFNQLDDELKTALAEVTQTVLWERDIQNSLVKDEVLGYNIKEKGSAAADKLSGLAKGIIRRRLLENPQAGSNRTQLINETVAELRTLVKDVGTLTNPIPPSGLGPAPMSGRTEIYPTQKPKRPEAISGDHADFIADTIGYKLAQGLKRP